jgi:hypothetical protein
MPGGADFRVRNFGNIAFIRNDLNIFGMSLIENGHLI